MLGTVGKPRMNSNGLYSSALCGHWMPSRGPIKGKNELLWALTHELLWAPTHQYWQTKIYTHQLCADTVCLLEGLSKAIDDRDGWWERVKRIFGISTIRWLIMKFSLGSFKSFSFLSSLSFFFFFFPLSFFFLLISFFTFYFPFFLSFFLSLLIFFYFFSL